MEVSTRLINIDIMARQYKRVNGNGNTRDHIQDTRFHNERNFASVNYNCNNLRKPTVDEQWLIEHSHESQIVTVSKYEFEHSTRIGNLIITFLLKYDEFGNRELFMINPVGDYFCGHFMHTFVIPADWHQRVNDGK